ncbi:uncharacterized protein si:dkey-171c9.3 [Pristis pectinata]|uniref:uncharacterized protein si:dkey-171c9.3 n=1 Tax=Pristis pectinata TaxID=685728 RepID=UPI00223D4DA4|nr:uncharacterized protein si:dkey-171c9.3 [Pristis pectinata]
MSDPINWLQSTKKLCQVVIENREQQIPVPVKEEVTATYPELHELMESIQMHHLEEDDVILIKGLQQYSEAATDELQNSSEGVMCLSPSPSHSGSSVISSLRKYALGFQHAIHAITRRFADVSVGRTEKPVCNPTADVPLPDVITAQRINLSTPDAETSLHDVPAAAVDIPPPLTSEQLCQQNLVQSTSSFVQPAACYPPEGIQSSCVATDVDVGTPSNLLPPTGSQFLEKLSTFAEWMSNEILSSVNKDNVLQGTKPVSLEVKQPEVWTSSEDKFSSETFSHDTIPNSHLNQTFADIEVSLKSSQDYLRSSKPTESERNLEVLERGSRNAVPCGIGFLASREASNIIRDSFEEIGIGREKPLDDYILKTINASSSGEAFTIVLPVMENYALRLAQEVISDGTRRASLERKVINNSAEPLEEKSKNSHLGHLEPHQGKPLDLSEIQLSQSDTGTHELNHLARTILRSSSVGVSPLLGSEQVESLTKAAQLSFDDLSSERERHLSASDKERADDQDYEKLMYDKLGLTKKASLDYPDAPPPTPLKPQLVGSQRSFTRKLKGGLAKEFLPSTPPPTPKETINFCLPKEGREEKAEFMRKLIRSLSQEFSGKEAAGTSEVPEDERLQNVSHEFPGSGSEPTERLCTDEKKMQDYFSDLVSGIVFSSAQVICGIVGESIDPKEHNEQKCHGVAFSNDCQMNSHTMEKLNTRPSDVVILETQRIPSENNGDKHRVCFPLITENKLWEYTDRLTQEIISSVINFLSQIELLECGEHKVERKENGNKDCRHSCYIKQLNSMSGGLVKRVVQSSLHLFKTQYQLQPAGYASTVGLSQHDVDTVPTAEVLHNMDHAARGVEENVFLMCDNEEQQFIKPSLETMESGANSQAAALDSDPVFTGEEQAAGTQGSACRIGISNIASPHEGTNDKNDSCASSFSSPCPYRQSLVKVEGEELIGENLSGFVQAETKLSLYEQKKEKSSPFKDPDAFLDFNSESIINDEEKSSTLELTNVIMEDPDHKQLNKTYAESLAETILNSSLADVCRHCSSGLEVPTHSRKTDELHRNALSVSHSSGEESLEVQQKIQTEELFKERKEHVPLILNTKFQGLNVIEYTGDSSTKQPQENSNQSMVALKQCSEENEGSEEMEHCSFLAAKPIELLLVNFNSASTTVDVQVQAMLQWATASQLNVSKIHIKNSSEDFVQFPTLLTLAEEEEWTVGDLLCAVLAFCESNQSIASPTLFDYLLEPFHCIEADSKPHRTSS